MNPIVNNIIALDLVLGDLSRESEQCHSENKNMASLACLFILVEDAIKLGLHRNEGNFYDLIIIAKDEKIISKEDFIILDQVRNLRNKLFHENHYSYCMEIEGIAYFFSENETKKVIYNRYADKCFKIVLKILNNL
jgi:hypothetical protein